jgi:hypothetical protein
MTFQVSGVPFPVSEAVMPMIGTSNKAPQSIRPSIPVEVSTYVDIDQESTCCRQLERA